jgi:hypothetical protein
MNQFAIANFVTKFLADNGSKELVEKWNTQENIKAFNLVATDVLYLADKDLTKYTDQTLYEDNQAKKKVYKKEFPPKKKTGYTYFCSVKRERVKTDNPHMKAQDVLRELSRLWKALSKEDQKEWSASSAELYTYWKNLFDKNNIT